MDEKTLELLTEKMRTAASEVIDEKFDSYMEEKLAPVIGDHVSAQSKKIVQELRAERMLYGKDRTGLSDEMKENFVEIVKAAGGFKTKADALIEAQDNRGGYLVPEEVDASIRRIAASVGLIMSQTEQFTMRRDNVQIPAYRGSFLEGEYIDEDSTGSTTAITFSQARLLAKTWQLAFPVSNELLADSAVDLADWLLALAGEAQANMIDKQGFAGTGAPFVGVLKSDDVTTYTLGTGDTAFSNFSAAVDGSDIVGNLNESMLPGAAWYFHRTVWAKIRQETDSNGQPLLSLGGQPSMAILQNNPTGGAIRPMGELWGFPVYTTDHLPANSESAANTAFGIFGNFGASAFGRREGLRVAQHQSGTFDGKEISLANQTGLIYRARHGFVITLPAAFVVIKTAAS